LIRVNVAHLPPEKHPRKVHVAAWTERHGLSRDIWLASDDGMRQNLINDYSSTVART